MLVSWLEQLDPGTSVSVAGSKIARLAELAAVGLRVPDGFVVTTTAHQSFIDSGALADHLDNELASLEQPGQTLETVAQRIRNAIGAVPIPPETTNVIVNAYEELCDRRAALALPVAVRSSATGEDAADASFAGQFDTYLGLTGNERVLDGVRNCWASQFTLRAVDYRRQRGLSHRDSPMAVGILELVDAQASGVAFSIDPVKGRRDRIVVEASWGWGEANRSGFGDAGSLRDRQDRRSRTDTRHQRQSHCISLRLPSRPCR